MSAELTRKLAELRARTNEVLSHRKPCDCPSCERCRAVLLLIDVVEAAVAHEEACERESATGGSDAHMAGFRLHAALEAAERELP